MIDIELRKYCFKEAGEMVRLNQTSEDVLKVSREIYKFLTEDSEKVSHADFSVPKEDSNEIKNYRLARTIISKQNNFVHPEILPIEIELLNFLFPDRQDIIYNHEKECWLFKLDGIEIETKDHKELFVLLKQYYFKK